MFTAPLNWETFASPAMTVSATMFASLARPFASTTATATTTPQIFKNLIGRVRKNKRAARAARTYEKVRAVLCKTTT